MTARRLLDLAREAVLLELALYRSLVRWVARRPDVPAGATPIGYAQLVGPMLWLWIFGSATETVAVELVLRHVDLTLDEGELVLVSGRTGVGKSTLLGVVTGLVPRFTGGELTGDVLLDGVSILGDRAARRLNETGGRGDG